MLSHAQLKWSQFSAAFGYSPWMPFLEVFKVGTLAALLIQLLAQVLL
jgi:hypothetical protein